MAREVCFTSSATDARDRTTDRKVVVAVLRNGDHTEFFIRLQDTNYTLTENAVIDLENEIYRLAEERKGLAGVREEGSEFQFKTKSANAPKLREFLVELLATHTSYERVVNAPATKGLFQQVRSWTEPWNPLPPVYDTWSGGRPPDPNPVSSSETQEQWIGAKVGGVAAVIQDIPVVEAASSASGSRAPTAAGDLRLPEQCEVATKQNDLHCSYQESTLRTAGKQVTPRTIQLRAIPKDHNKDQLMSATPVTNVVAAFEILLEQIETEIDLLNRLGRFCLR